VALGGESGFSYQKRESKQTNGELKGISLVGKSTECNYLLQRKREKTESIRREDHDATCRGKRLKGGTTVDKEDLSATKPKKATKKQGTKEK